MNVTKCEECGYEISLKTDTCLNCGVKIGRIKKGGRTGFFRRIVFIIIAIYILLAALKIFK
ncbi:MAG: hypothetical protein ACR2NW_02590 [Thermodesulfobacteriota bacterium]